MACPLSSWPCSACAIVSITSSFVSRRPAKSLRNAVLRSSLYPVIRRDHARRRAGLAGELLLRLRRPGGEIGIVHHPDRDRHERMVLAAQLGALAVEYSGRGRLEPRVIDAARHGIDLDAERRHRE